MKQTKRLIALILCMAMILTLFGCQTEQTESTSPATEGTESNESLSPALDAYTAARAALAVGNSGKIHIRTETTTTVGGETFIEESLQTLQFSGTDTDAPLYALEELISYDDIYYVAYEEVWTDGILYVTVDDAHHFSGAVTAEELSSRYLPAVLLDETLYGEVTMDGSVITFSAPTAGESWALPEGAELVEATGSAELDASGELSGMSYSITYTYGSAEISLTVDTKITDEAVTIEVPDTPSDFLPLEHVDAARMSERAMGYLYEAEAVNLSALESIMSQAAGAVRNQSTILNSYGTGDDIQIKLETGIYLMNYAINQTDELDQEELFRDGKYTISTDGSEPTEQSGITAELVEKVCDELRGSHMIDFDYWKDAKVTDLGSLYLIELTFNSEFGDTVQGNVCSVLLGDPDLLNDLASDYTTNDVSGYFAVDKYTGLPTAAGYIYEGVHTIEGQDYILTFQTDQSIEAPCLGAYHAITEEMLQEEEPEVKATPLFYHVTGENGQEMWLFGTIHVGDERTAYLPQEIYDALASSDALALEYYSKAFEDQMDEDEALSDAVSDAYYYSGSTTADHISEELYEDALLYLKATGSYNMNAPYMKSYLWGNMIDNFYLRQGYQLTSEQGLESRLEKFAEDLGIEIRDVESGLFQIQMMTGWSDKLQELLLEETLATNAQESWEGTMELFEMWCAGDEAELREMLSDAVDTSEFTEEELIEYEEQLPYIEEYNKSMSYDRNDGMLEVAISYLESGETVFYAVGLAHLLNDVNGLVDTLREAGYTVELVEYAQ